VTPLEDTSNLDASAVALRVLGPLEIVVDRAAREVRGARRLSLLLRLLVDAGRVVPSEQLIEDLWDGSPPAGAATTLHSHVRELRKIVGPHLVLTRPPRPPGYVLAVDETRIDAARFESELVESRARLAIGDATAALELVERCLARWRGHALVEVADKPWAAPEAARLEELRRGAVEAMLEARLACQEPSAVVAAAESAVADEPLREQRWSRLMESLYRSGRQADALRAYQRLRTVLAEELGIEPNPALQALEHAILEQDPALGVVTRRDATSEHERAAGAVPAAALAALQRRDWAEAFGLLDTADHGDGLSAAGLDALADAAWFVGRADAAVEARCRAHVAYLEDGDRHGAAFAALVLVAHHLMRLRPSVATGWYHKGRRLLEGLPEGPAHGVFSFDTALFQLAGGDLDGALDSARNTARIGRECNNADFEAIGLAFEGVALVRQGDVGAGTALMDEGMAAAASGLLGPVATGIIYCRSICACLDMLDYQRAGEWTDAVTEWTAATGAADYPGDCRTHRAEILFMAGAWDEAADWATRSCSETSCFDLTHTAIGRYVLGMIKLRRGDLGAADAVFQHVIALGGNVQPGLALLRLAQGRTNDAATLIACALAEPSEPLLRARLLPAHVEIAIAHRDLSLADEASRACRELAEQYDTALLHATAKTASGAVALATGQPTRAISELSRARELWTTAGLPYELSRTRSLLADAFEAEGDLDRAVGERDAARVMFERLGASRDLVQLAPAD
jgi:DNA-binding SARP family transcriptional activator